MADTAPVTPYQGQRNVPTKQTMQQLLTAVAREILARQGREALAEWQRRLGERWG